MKIVFIKDCLKMKPIRFYRVEALYILVLVEEINDYVAFAFIINCFYPLSKFIDFGFINQDFVHASYCATLD